ncbi:MAG: phosphatase PAP2 family protein [Rikenellaceae bacterium]|nr:phosphatase PAP2 family protein [Rikenellaceae bacterium]
MTLAEKLLDTDRTLFLAMNGDGGPFADALMWALSSEFALVPVGVVALWLMWRRYDDKRCFFVAILFIALVVLLSDRISTTFKYVLPKLRPTHEPLLDGLVHTVYGYRGGLYGTVSSHAANSFGVSLFTSLVIRRKWYTLTVMLMSAAICYSRIYLGAHYPADIFFGTVTGLLFGWLCYKMMNFITPKLFKR